MKIKLPPIGHNIVVLLIAFFLISCAQTLPRQEQQIHSTKNGQAIDMVNPTNEEHPETISKPDHQVSSIEKLPQPKTMLKTDQQPLQKIQHWKKEISFSFEQDKKVLGLGKWLTMSLSLKHIEDVPEDLQFEVTIGSKISVKLNRAGDNVWQARKQLVTKGIVINQQPAHIFALYGDKKQQVSKQGLISIDTQVPEITAFDGKIRAANQLEFNWLSRQNQGDEVIQLYYQEDKQQPIKVKRSNHPKIKIFQTKLKNGGQWFITITDSAGNMSKPSKRLSFNGFHGCFDIFRDNGNKLSPELCLDYRGSSDKTDESILSFRHNQPNGQQQNTTIKTEKVTFEYHYSLNNNAVKEYWEISPDSKDKSRWHGSIKREILSKKYLYVIHLVTRKGENSALN